MEEGVERATGGVWGEWSVGKREGSDEWERGGERVRRRV